MKAFTKPIDEITKKIEQLTETGITDITGVSAAAQAHLMYCVHNDVPVKLIVTVDEKAALDFLGDIRLFDTNTVYFPPKDLIFYQSDLNGNLLSARRQECFRAMLTSKRLTIVTTIDALMEKRPDMAVLRKNVINIDNSSEIDTLELSSRLNSIGYKKTEEVSASGEFAIRGGIIDIYPVTYENPVRIELFGSDVDSMRYFDVGSQRSGETVDEVSIFPMEEYLTGKVQVEEGLERIRAEFDERYASLRKEMKTEEAARLKSAVYEFLEDIETFKDTSKLGSYLGYFYEKLYSFLDFLEPEYTCIMLAQPARIAERAEKAQEEFADSMGSRAEGGYILPGQAELLFSAQQTFRRLEKFKVLGISEIALGQKFYEPLRTLEVEARQIGSYNGSFAALETELKRYRNNDYAVIILSASHTRARRLSDDLNNDGVTAFYTEDYDRIPEKKEIMVVYGNKLKGFEYPSLKFAVISETDIFGGIRKKRRRVREYSGEKISSFSELSVGDYVVHEDYGIGIYTGIEHIELDGVTRDYLGISYQNNAHVYVGASNLNSLQKYAAADTEKKPKINKIGGKEWGRTRQRVRQAVQGMARSLVDLYALRSHAVGFRFGKDTVWQKEFEELFPFEETDDQIHAIEAVKSDMESDKIMDRLICGDVGFGKTEVAIRAAFKAVQDGKQVAVLVPTTILAKQHYNTFNERMKNYPVRVDLLCRFRSAKEQKQTIADLKKGQVDIVIGTHRLLSKDIDFKDLGLLIIDEEQRFGVAHKEKIKELRKNVDVLALTATPIPRTLHMSLVGIRDMSVLEEAPLDRLPIQTFIMEYSIEIVREAINREIGRGGQVYYVYNRVNDIEDIVDSLRAAVPKARIEYAHGQMPERQLEDIMSDFIEGNIDVLVSTTIIETGMDIPNVNTMIIHNSDRMGLSQLYQLRGRVGRSNRTAYAFLMYNRDKLLKETAEKRLSAIREFTDLGSGFKIAMKDLEIRGAGNLLGAEQHGHIDAVGYDLYCKMLNSAVKEEKGEKPEIEFTTTVDINTDAYIPDSYVGSENTKLDLYKRIAGIENTAEAEDMEEELTDRFGKPPVCVQNLIQIALLRGKAHEVFVETLSSKGEEIIFAIFPKAVLNPLHIGDVLGDIGENLSFQASGKPSFIYRLPSEASDPIEASQKILASMRILLED